ncbi:Protein Wnt-7b, partial [Geodia barretti]
AFVHALTSAITVYKITEACYNNDLGTYCGRDHYQGTINGHSVISPYNITVGKRFAQRFLDDRPLQVLTNQSSSDWEKIQAQLQIHNNGAGRQVVHDNRQTTCICSGVSGSCTVKTCTTHMPSIFEIGDIMKTKQEEALKVVTVYEGSRIKLLLEQRTREGEGEPPATELIYMATPSN